MRIRYFVTSVTVVAMLSACGGGGSGGVNSTPTPTPTNTTLTDLKYSQSFANNAANLTGDWDKTTSTAISGQSQASNLTVSYDATNGSYTLASGGNTQTFASADINSQDAYETVYLKTSSTGSDHLTLVKTSYTGGLDAQYVGMGYWQRTGSNGTTQSIDFTSFTYGITTPASGVPRTGTAAYATEVFGLVTKPGEEPESFEGGGQLSLDFSQGIFTTQAYTTETGLVSGSGIVGGGIELNAGGKLSSTDGTFSGTATYGSRYGETWGTISGSLYGPDGQEVGATFQTSGADGLVAVGSLIGVKDAGLVPENQTLTDMTQQQLFYTKSEYSTGQLNWLNSATFDFSPPSSDMAGGRFTAADEVISDDPNFTAYAKAVDAGYQQQDITLELYRPGTANKELALTYSSFGHWTGTTNGTVSDWWFTYGFTTGSNYLAARTGTARYEGVAYGTGTNANGSAKYDITGTAGFNVDFSSQSLTGSLALNGTNQVTGGTTSFGSYDVAATINTRASSFQADFQQGAAYGGIYGQFFGSDAQELTGTYHVNLPAGSGDPYAMNISGAFATVRK